MRFHLLIYAASLLASCNLEKDTYSMQSSSSEPALFRIDSIEQKADCVDVSLSPATWRATGPIAGSVCSGQGVRLLEIARDKSRIVAVTIAEGADEPLILPVTVGLSVEPSGNQEGEALYFVAPRPALVRVRPKDNDLDAALKAIADNGQGVILALHDGTFASDVLPISAEEAEKLLGFAS